MSFPLYKRISMTFREERNCVKILGNKASLVNSVNHSIYMYFSRSLQLHVNTEYACVYFYLLSLRIYFCSRLAPTMVFTQLGDWELLGISVSRVAQKNWPSDRDSHDTQIRLANQALPLVGTAHVNAR